MARGQTPLYLGTNRHVVAMDPRMGTELWRTKLPHGGTGAPVTLLIKGQNIFVGTFGHVYCLDKRNGTIVWENGLPKTGYHSVMLAMEGATGISGGAVAADTARRRQNAAATSAAT